MTLDDFLTAAASGVDLKLLSKMLKELPQEDRHVAGVHFQEIKLKRPTSVTVPAKHWAPTGQFLWSLDVGPLGYGVTMYENELLIGVDRRKSVLITGQNLAIKEIKTQCHPRQQ